MFIHRDDDLVEEYFGGISSRSQSMRAVILALSILIWCTITCCAGLSVPGRLQQATCVTRRRTDLAALHGAATTAPAQPVVSPNMKKTAAKLMGYTLGLGATTLYAPIIAKLLRTGDASGLSLSTWVLNVLGTVLAIAYPIKRGFPVSTYAELTAVLLQAVAVLGLLSHHHHALLQFVVGISTLAVVFLAFVRNNRIPEAVTRALQLASITICTAATVPQIVLTFQTGKVGWSWITALLSTTGCLVRVFTTLQLTQDRTALVGYVLGSVTNGILLGQVLWYGRPH